MDINNPIDIAAVQQYIESNFKNGSTYGSIVEKQADFAHPAADLKGPVGDTFRAYRDAKIARSVQAKGPECFQKNVIDEEPRFATASSVRDKSGKLTGIDAKEVSISQKTGAKAFRDDEGRNGQPKVTDLGGGTLRAALEHKIKPIAVDTTEEGQTQPKEPAVRVSYEIPLLRK